MQIATNKNNNNKELSKILQFPAKEKKAQLMRTKKRNCTDEKVSALSKSPRGRFSLFSMLSLAGAPQLLKVAGFDGLLQNFDQAKVAFTDHLTT